MAKQTSNKAVGQAEQECFFSATTIAALLFLAAKFPHRQFNSSELCVLSGIGRTAMSQIRTPPTRRFRLENARYSGSTDGLPSIQDSSNNDRLGGCICQKGFAKALRSPVCLRRP